MLPLALFANPALGIIVIMRLLTYFCVASVASSLQLARQSGAVESATDFLLDAKMQIQQMDDLKQDVEALSQDVQAGGDKAKWELLFCASTPYSINSLF